MSRITIAPGLLGTGEDLSNTRSDSHAPTGYKRARRRPTWQNRQNQSSGSYVESMSDEFEGLTKREAKRIKELLGGASQTESDVALITKYNTITVDMNEDIKKGYDLNKAAYERGDQDYQLPDTIRMKTIPGEIGDVKGDLMFDDGSPAKEEDIDGPEGVFLWTDDGVLAMNRMGEDRLEVMDSGNYIPLHGNEFEVGSSNERRYPFYKKVEEMRGKSYLGEKSIGNANGSPTPDFPDGVFFGERDVTGRTITVNPVFTDTAETNNMGDVDVVMSEDNYIKIRGVPSTQEEETVPGATVQATAPVDPEYHNVIGLDKFDDEKPAPEVVHFPDRVVRLGGEEEEPEDKRERLKDPLFVPNLLANLAWGLETWNLQGINIPVPDYDQPKYQSQELGPAVNNMFRGGN